MLCPITRSNLVEKFRNKLRIDIHELFVIDQEKTKDWTIYPGNRHKQVHSLHYILCFNTE
jgi:hypothetical protein